MINYGENGVQERVPVTPTSQLELGLLEAPGQTKRTRRRVSPDTYRQFVTSSDRLGLNPNRVLDNTREKRDLIRGIMGYTHLKVEGGRAPIGDCSEGRIGQMFKDTYYRAQRALRPQHK